MNVKYYSQFSQDKIIESIFPKDYQGFFIEVGAHNGEYYSNTLFFEETKKWRGICIEPIEDLYKECVKKRPGSLCYNNAISNVNNSTVMFCENTGYTSGLSGIMDYYEKEHLDRIRRENRAYGSTSLIKEVKSRTLQSILDENSITKIDYLSVDVEGAELSVLQSIDFEKTHIEVIDFEANYSERAQEVVEFLVGKNFELLQITNIPSIDLFMINKNGEVIKRIK